MLIECGNCGAPLDVRPNDSLARCCYCGKTQRVRTAKTQMHQTPPQWQPPREWIPPAHFRVPQVALRFDPSKTVRSVVIIIVVFSVVTGIIPIACAAFFFIGALASAPSPSKPRTPDPKPDSKPDKKSSSLNAACKKAKKCCEIALPEDTTSCDQIAAANDATVCNQAMTGFRQAAQARGKSCD